MIAICREMGWDYYTYVSQPFFFLDAVKAFLIAEQRAQAKAIREAKRQ